MTLDETFTQFFTQFFDTRIVGALGQNYKKMPEALNDLNKAKEQHSQKIDSLEKKVDDIPKTFGRAMTELQSSLTNYVNNKIANELATAKQPYLQKNGELEAKIQTHAEIIRRVNAGNNEHSQKIDSLEKTINGLSKNINRAMTELQSSLTNYVNSQINRQIDSVITSNKELGRRIAALEAKNNTLMPRNNEYESKRVPPSPAQPVQTDSNITRFNVWAANPTMRLPSAFTFLAGEPRILTAQQLAETTEETKWITNRTGARKYLFPNPNLFNQMTDIRELYDMDQRMLKEKGKNKIQIITPCEISATGWIEFPGELKILP
jgi:flagellar biosynthesis chaperone FliJ